MLIEKQQSLMKTYTCSKNVLQKDIASQVMWLGKVIQYKPNLRTRNLNSLAFFMLRLIL